MNYPIADRWLLVSGFRLASRFSYEDFKMVDLRPIETPADYKRVTSQDFFAEIPFRFRFILKNINRENRLYLESGIQFNTYIFSHWKEKYLNSFVGEPIEEKIERSNNFRDMFLTSNFSFGWEKEMSRGPKFFIQAIGRFELAPADYYDANAIHVGIETGFRF